MWLWQFLYSVGDPRPRRLGICMEILTFTGGAFVQNTLLVVCDDGRTALLVDPGAATPDALAVVRDLDLDVAAILLTHAHLDHVEGVGAARQATQAPIHLHPLDRILYDNVASQAAAFGVPCDELPPPDAQLVPGVNLAFGGTEFEVVFAPGHAPGHVMFVSVSEPVAIVGDVIFMGSIGRTDLPGGDYQVLMNSIRSEVLPMPAETRLLPGHGPETTVGHERETNPFLIPVYSGEPV